MNTQTIRCSVASCPQQNVAAFNRTAMRAPKSISAKVPMCTSLLPSQTSCFGKALQISTKQRSRGSLKVQAAEVAEEVELYEAELEKPIGVKFTRGNDGGAYVINVPNDPRYDEFEIGDKVMKISASFGPDVWDAQNYGQVMYAMKTRNGDVFMQLKKMNGDMSAFEAKKTSKFAAERAGGNYGSGTAEVQQKNYIKAKEASEERKSLFYEGMEKFKAKQYDEALMLFENVVGLEPKNYIGDNMSKTTDVYRVAQYNVACCYSMINSIDAGLEALDKCMAVGFDDYKKIRSDPGLANLRAAEDKFNPVINKYDEPLFNENAFKAIKNLFGNK